jgi:hypothetical protein
LCGHNNFLVINFVSLIPLKILDLLGEMPMSDSLEKFTTRLQTDQNKIKKLKRCNTNNMIQIKIIKKRKEIKVWWLKLDI